MLVRVSPGCVWLAPDSGALVAFVPFGRIQQCCASRLVAGVVRRHAVACMPPAVHR